MVDGTACTTSDECGELRCIDEHCHDPAALLRHPLQTSGDRAMFGDGHGYQLAVVVGDIAATVTVPALVAVGAFTGSSWFGVLALFPTTLTGPIIHFAHGRSIPGTISLFGWAAVPATALGIAVLGAAAADDFAIGTGTFIGVASAGAIAMTVLDWYLARDVTVRQPASQTSVVWAPSVVPMHGGGWAGISGAW